MLTARQLMWGVEAPRRRSASTRPQSGPKTSKRPKRAPRQLSLAEVTTRGGPRPGSGRKPRDPSARKNVVHRTRPAHDADSPVHITMRRAKGLPSFRSERVRRVLERAVRDTRRAGFRIAHYSIQADHIHFIIEADDDLVLTNGMRSLSVRIAMRVNGTILGRTSGRVWGDRYHRRDLSGPRAVRNALVYVLANHLKHGEYDVGLLDPCSSGAWFTGWSHSPDPPPEPSPVEPGTTWVLRDGWITKGGGRVRLGEVPRALRPIELRDARSVSPSRNSTSSPNDTSKTSSIRRSPATSARSLSSTPRAGTTTTLRMRTPAFDTETSGPPSTPPLGTHAAAPPSPSTRRRSSSNVNQRAIATPEG